MASISLEQREVLEDCLLQIKDGIENLLKWNEKVRDMNELLMSPGGMQDLAGNCMLIMAVAEGFKKIDKITEGQFLTLRPEIPWKQVFGLRNRIAHGYFDIDTEVITEVICHDLTPLLEATNYLLSQVSTN